MIVLLLLRLQQVSYKLMSRHGVHLLCAAILWCSENALINMLHENKMDLEKNYTILININSHLYGIAHNFQYTLEHLQYEERFRFKREWHNFFKKSMADTLLNIICLLIRYSTSI